ncbi:MAG: RNA polymerase sigma factor, partial [Bryobacteraceae bacterium]
MTGLEQVERPGQDVHMQGGPMPGRYMGGHIDGHVGGHMSDAAESPKSGALSLSSQETRDLHARLISENLRRIFLQIYRIVGNVDDAQDLTQEAFIKALQR